MKFQKKMKKHYLKYLKMTIFEHVFMCKQCYFWLICQSVFLTFSALCLGGRYPQFVVLMNTVITTTIITG